MVVIFLNCSSLISKSSYMFFQLNLHFSILNFWQIQASILTIEITHLWVKFIIISLNSLLRVQMITLRMCRMSEGQPKYILAIVIVETHHLQLQDPHWELVKKEVNFCLSLFTSQLTHSKYYQAISGQNQNLQILYQAIVVINFNLNLKLADACSAAILHYFSII